MKIVFPDYLYLTEEHKQQLQSLGEVTIYDDLPNSEAEIISRIAGVDLIVASWVNITDNIIKSSPSLKYIIVSAVGYDFVDVKAATQSDVKVINCPTHNALAVAEFTIALILALTRKVVAANIALSHGNWDTHEYRGIELDGKILGLVGHGNVARKVAQLASSFGMETIYADSKASPSQLDELIAVADVLSLHLPLTPQSQHLIDQRRLNLMKKSAYLINTARGAIIDQKALVTVLQERQIAGAALDVFENEPLSGSPSEEIMQLIQLDNVVATPHIAYNSEETAIRLGEELIGNIEACINNHPINVVN